MRPEGNVTGQQRQSAAVGRAIRKGSPTGNPEPGSRWTNQVGPVFLSPWAVCDPVSALTGQASAK